MLCIVESLTTIHKNIVWFCYICSICNNSQSKYCYVLYEIVQNCYTYKFNSVSYCYVLLGYVQYCAIRVRLTSNILLHVLYNNSGNFAPWVTTTFPCFRTRISSKSQQRCLAMTVPWMIFLFGVLLVCRRGGLTTTSIFELSTVTGSCRLSNKI